MDMKPKRVQGAELDHCPKCGGMFFDHGEFGKFVKERKSAFERTMSFFGEVMSFFKGKQR